VSLCNPPCAAGESCTAAGECVGASRTAGPVGAEGDTRPRRRRQRDEEVETDEAEEEDAPVEPSTLLQHLGKWVFALRGGFGVIGSGTVENECSSSGGPLVSCGGSASSDNDAEEKSIFMLQADALVHVSRGLRLGVGYQIIPYSAAKYKGTTDPSTQHNGHEHALRGAVEGLLPIGQNLAIALRAQGGVRMLSIGGDLADDTDDVLRTCSQMTGTHCEVDKGPMFGSSFGATAGIVGGKKLHWRVDLAVDRDSYKIWESTISFPAGGTANSLTVKSTQSMTRSWILAGIELF
jgi:hypothetical protein